MYVVHQISKYKSTMYLYTHKGQELSTSCVPFAYLCTWISLPHIEPQFFGGWESNHRGTKEESSDQIMNVQPYHISCLCMALPQTNICYKQHIIAYHSISLTSAAACHILGASVSAWLNGIAAPETHRNGRSHTPKRPPPWSQQRSFGVNSTTNPSNQQLSCLSGKQASIPCPTVSGASKGCPKVQYITKHICFHGGSWGKSCTSDIPSAIPVQSQYPVVPPWSSRCFFVKTSLSSRQASEVSWWHLLPAKGWRFTFEKPKGWSFQDFEVWMERILQLSFFMSFSFCKVGSSKNSQPKTEKQVALAQTATSTT